MFISRQRIRFPPDARSESFIDIIDLNIGHEVELYGRVFKIVNCDRFTRNFLNRLGITVPDPIVMPEDPYMERRNKVRNKGVFIASCPSWHCPYTENERAMKSCSLNLPTSWQINNGLLTRS